MYLSMAITILQILATAALLTSSKQLTYVPPGEQSECTLSLVALSRCLSDIAGPPNHAPSAPSDIGCCTFYQTIMIAGPACVCYLVRDTLILGFPIDTRRLVAMFPSCEVNDTTTAVHWLYDTCRDAHAPPLPEMTLSFAAPPPAESTHNVEREMWSYTFLLINNLFNWFVLIQFEVQNIGQSYMYLGCLFLNSIPVFLIPDDHYTIWDSIKLSTGLILTLFTILLDMALYTHFGHHWAVIGFWIVETVGAVVVRVFGMRAAYIVQIIDGATNLSSASILIVFLLWKENWEYAPPEAFSAILAVFYTLTSFLKACDTTDTTNMVLTGLALLARILYGLLLCNRSTITRIIGRVFNRHPEDNPIGWRVSRSWQPIWERVKEWLKIWWTTISEMFCDIKFLFFMVWTIFKICWTQKLMKYVKEKMTTWVKSIASRLWPAVQESEPQGEGP